ncbi:DUF72 domain-containing protein [Pedobacter sp. HMF7647]|uniref:DUF72 domain-containing protein n=1 Tax=Hufsiella arboris TaxID=2695275 RepID=A0A7K1Y836_9SPHI|nr:DUF72 domain-containing protein [Hufsiella arboris]MXV50259.1 DUF72 domain-containing protein [Hufsiella arboris]
MDFGRIPVEELAQTDLSLPPDSALTNKVLSGSKVTKPQLYVGCAKWGRKEWVGMIYPPKTKEAKFLDEYVKHFNSIELNAVFYGMPKPEQIRTWKNKAEAEGRDFKFCPKFTQSISHIRRLKNAEAETEKYLESISEFAQYLGPCFLQLSDNFGPKNFDTLRDYLEGLPNDFQVFTEVRHKDWFSDQTARTELFSMLHDLKRGSVITDAAGRRDCVHMEMPANEAFIRFVGNGLHPTDYERIDEWVDRIKKWIDSGLQSLFFFLHQHDEKDTPVLADYTIRKLNQSLGSAIPTPEFFNNSSTLF